MGGPRPSHIIEIPEEYLTDFERDPVVAWRSYGDYPQDAEFPYLENRNAIHAMVDKSRHNPFNAETFTFHPDFRCNDDFYRFMHIDLALSGDAAGLSMCHVVDWVRTRVKIADKEMDSPYEYVPIVKFDLLARFLPPEGGQIKFSQIRQVIYDLNDRGFSILLITFDRFQSADTMQILREKGYICANLSLDRTSNYPVVDGDKPDRYKKVSTGMGKYSTLSVWTSFKEAMNAGRIQLPFYLPVSDTMVDHYGEEIYNVDDYGNRLKETEYITQVEKEAFGATFDGKVNKVKESPKGSIDLLESVAGSYYNAQNNVGHTEVKETEQERQVRLAKRFKEARTDFEREQITKEALPQPTEKIKDSMYSDEDIGGSIFGGDSIFDEE